MPQKVGSSIWSGKIAVSQHDIAALQTASFQGKSFYGHIKVILVNMCDRLCIYGGISTVLFAISYHFKSKCRCDSRRMQLPNRMRFVVSRSNFSIDGEEHIRTYTYTATCEMPLVTSSPLENKGWCRTCTCLKHCTGCNCSFISNVVLCKPSHVNK